MAEVEGLRPEDVLEVIDALAPIPDSYTIQPRFVQVDEAVKRQVIDVVEATRLGLGMRISLCWHFEWLEVRVSWDQVNIETGEVEPVNCCNGVEYEQLNSHVALKLYILDTITDRAKELAAHEIEELMTYQGKQYHEPHPEMARPAQGNHGRVEGAK